MGFGAGAVDFVGQQHLGKQGAGVEDEFLLGSLINRNTRQVARHQISRELNAGKLQAKRSGQGMGQRGFAHARHVFYEQVPPGQKADDAVLILINLA